MVVMKTNDALRKIGEVSKELEIPIHVIRFWEQKFPTLNPIKKNNGQRYFSIDQLIILREIKSLLYNKKYTIEGAIKFLKENDSLKKNQLVQELENLINEIKSKI